MKDPDLLIPDVIAESAMRYRFELTRDECVDLWDRLEKMIYWRKGRNALVEHSDKFFARILSKDSSRLED